MIIKKTEIPNSEDTSLILLIQGAPGVGKTTLCNSAENPFLLDIDHGLKRVKPEHRADYSDSKTFEEIKADVEEAKKLGYKTLIIDTVGALLDSITAYIIKDNPKNAQPDGTLTLKAYGVLKGIFLNFSADVRASFKNVIFVFHEVASRDNDGNTFYDIIAVGSAKTLVYQPADLACRMFVQGGKRYLGFTPTEQYNAKSSFGIKGLIEVPELNEGDKNDFLTRLFALARQNIQKEAEAFAPQNEAYELAMKAGTEIVNGLEKPEDVPAILEAIAGIKHASTSEKEIKAALKKKMAELGITFDKATKQYVSAPAK